METPTGVVWRRPPPSPLGDHYAERLEIPPRAAPGVRRVAFFGESAAAGYLLAPHWTPARALEAHLAGLAAEAEPEGPGGASLLWEVLDLARTNERSASLAATVEDAAQWAPDHLVVFTGNNPKLLDTPELSPYAPDPEARREVGVVLGEGGPEALARLARRRWASALATCLERVAAVAEELGAGVTLVVPEVHLAGWETAQPPVRLAGDGGRRWFEHLETARRGLAEGRPEVAAAAAWAMVDLDGGLNPTPFRLLAAARLAAGTVTEARDAVLSELEATHYPLLANLAAPQADDTVRRVLVESAARHGFETVDLRPLFAEWSGSPLPACGQEALFLDYCHLTVEGIHLAMAAVAGAILGRPESGLALARALPDPRRSEGGPSPSTEAMSWLAAAVHTAHRHRPVTDRDEEVVAACRRALELDPAHVVEAMIDLAMARLALVADTVAGFSAFGISSASGTSSAFGTAVPALVTAGERRSRARSAPWLVQHGWRWPHLDGDLLRAFHRALVEAGRSEAADLAALVKDIGPASGATAAESPGVAAAAGSAMSSAVRSDRSEDRRKGASSGPEVGPDLVHPPLYLAYPVERPLPAAMAAEGQPPRAYLRSVWPQISFDFVDPRGQWRRLRIVARRPGATIGASACPPATVLLNGERVGEVPLSAEWREWVMDLPPSEATSVEIAATECSPHLPGLHRLTVAWPPLPEVGANGAEDPLAEAVARLERGLEAEVHAVFGELFALRLLA